MLFSLLSLIGATVLLYVQLNGLYDAQAFIIAYPAIKQSRQTLLYNLTRWRVLYDVFLVLSWSAIFSVKFSFLAFLPPIARRRVQMARAMVLVCCRFDCGQLGRYDGQTICCLSTPRKSRQ